MILNDGVVVIGEALRRERGEERERGVGGVHWSKTCVGFEGIEGLDSSIWEEIGGGVHQERRLVGGAAGGGICSKIDGLRVGRMVFMGGDELFLDARVPEILHFIVCSSWQVLGDL